MGRSADDTENGQPIWANDAFQRLPEEERRTLMQAEGRVSLDVEERQVWLRREGGGDVGFALPSDDLVRAEEGLRDLVQTMTQTFALLPLGLAVFDRSRHLASFNPALAELTGLSPAFLSRKPSLVAMLDAMRDRSMVPEPKDWKGWRSNVANADKTVQGFFEDVWALPGGQTYRVTGRHQKMGGLVLMIEDISSEVIQGRRYRASLALCQSVIDRMEEGVAVFAASGKMVLSNAAYSALWDHDPGTGLAQIDLGDVLAHWRQRSAATGLWADLEGYVGRTDDRRGWHGEARLNDGRLLRCRCEPLRDGATLVAFRPVAAEGPPRAISAESA